MHMFEVLKMLYLYLINVDDERQQQYSLEVAQLLYEMEATDGSPKFEEFVKIMKEELKNEFPDVKK